MTEAGLPAGGSFTEQVAIVTGGAQGLGFAVAELLADAGATVVLFDRDRERLERARASLTDRGLSADAHVADLTREAEVNEAVARTAERHGRIDVLVNLAAIYPFLPFAETSLDDWHAVTQSSLDTTFLCCRAVVPLMQERGYGRIVNTSSSTFQTGQPGMAAYVAAKAGILGFTRVLAREIGASGVTANVIMPGLIETAQALATAPDVVFDQHIADQCVKRRGAPRDIAAAVAFLAGRDAGFITGQTLNVDGGLSHY